MQIRWWIRATNTDFFSFTVALKVQDEAFNLEKL